MCHVMWQVGGGRGAAGRVGRRGGDGAVGMMSEECVSHALSQPCSISHITCCIGPVPRAVVRGQHEQVGCCTRNSVWGDRDLHHVCIVCMTCAHSGPSSPPCFSAPLDCSRTVPDLRSTAPDAPLVCQPTACCTLAQPLPCRSLRTAAVAPAELDVCAACSTHGSHFSKALTNQTTACVCPARVFVPQHAAHTAHTFI